MKKRKAKIKANSLQLTIGLAVLVLVGAMILVITGVFDKEPLAQPVLIAEDKSPSSQLSAITINTYNKANNSDAGNFDATMYLFEAKNGVAGKLVHTITDTTAPSSFNENYGGDYILKVIGSDGANGDTSNILEQVSTDGAEIIDGNLHFSANKAATDIEIYMNQHATIECKAYDNKNRGLLYNTGGEETAIDFETTGVEWTSTTDNATAYDESSGMDIEYECQAVEVDADYNDRGVYILFEAPTTKWKEPVVYLNGNKLTELSASFNTYEKDAFTEYEHAFLIPKGTVIKDDGEGFTLRFILNLRDGVTSATADPGIDFSVITQTKSTTKNEVFVSAATDAASPASIITLYTSTIDVTA